MKVGQWSTTYRPSSCPAGIFHMQPQGGVAIPLFLMIRPDHERKVLSKQADQKARHDRYAHERELGIGCQHSGPLKYLVKLRDGWVWRHHHVDHVRILNTPPSEGEEELEPTLYPSVQPHEAVSSDAPVSPTCAPCCMSTPPLVEIADIPPSQPTAPASRTEPCYPQRVWKEPDRFCNSYMFT